MMLFVIFSKEKKNHHASVILKFLTSRLFAFDLFGCKCSSLCCSTMLQMPKEGKQMTAVASVVLTWLTIERPRLQNPAPHLRWKSNVIKPNSETIRSRLGTWFFLPKLAYSKKFVHIGHDKAGKLNKSTAPTLVKLYQLNIDVLFSSKIYTKVKFMVENLPLAVEALERHLKQYQSTKTLLAQLGLSSIIFLKL